MSVGSPDAGSYRTGSLGPYSESNFEISQQAALGFLPGLGQPGGLQQP